MVKAQEPNCAKPQWAVTVSCGGNQYSPQSVAIDQQGNVYITGYFNGTCTFGNYSLNAGGIDYQNVFVAKMSPQGQWLWAVQAVGSTSIGYSFSIAVDAQGNAFITGLFNGGSNGTVNFGNTTLNAGQLQQVFVAKISSQGEWLWALSVGYSYAFDIDLRVPTIAVDNLGSAFLSGTFTGSVTFGNTTLSSSGSRVIVAKLSTDGQWQWAQEMPQVQSMRGRSICLDDQGNVLLTGIFYGTTTIGGTTLTSFGGYDVIVAKLNSQGQWQWAVNAGGTGQEKARSIAVDLQGNAYITGSVQTYSTFGTINIDVSNGGFVAKINSQGQWQWVRATGVEGRNIAVDDEGNAFVRLWGFSVSDLGVAASPLQGGFVAKLNTQGQWQWAAWDGQGSNSIDRGGDIGLTGDGFILIGSYQTNESQYYAFPGFPLLPGGKRMFVAKLEELSFFINAGSDQSIVCGSSTGLITTLSGTFSNVSYSWAPSVGIVAGNYTSSPTVKPTSTTDYIVTADLLGCPQATDTIRVVVTPLTVNAGSDQSIVCGSTTNLSSTLNATVPNVTYSWSPTTGLTSGTNTSAPTARPTTTTTYTVTASITGCTPATDAVQVTVNPLTVNAGSDQAIVCGSTAGLNAALNGTVPNVTYIWTPSTGLTGPGTATPSAKPTTTTTYTVTASVTGCAPATDAVQVTVNPLTVNAGSDQTITCGNTANLSATPNGTVPNASYTWSPTTGLTGSSSASPTATPIATTTYTVTANVAGCTPATDAVQVTVNPYTVNATASLSSVNCGSPTVLNAALSTGAPQGVTYSWSPNYNLSSPTAQNPTATPGTTTTYTVTATSPNGCTATGSVTVNVNNPNPPVATITTNTGNERLCNGSLTLNAGSSNSYLWSTGATSQSVTVTQPGTYTVTIEDQNGCAGSGSITVTPFVNIIAPQGTLVCTNQSNTVQLDAGTGYTSYQWSTGSNSQFITVSQPGTYTVNVTQGSCTGTASMVVTQSTGQATADFSYAVSGLTVDFTAIGNGINFVSWDFGNGQTSFDLNPTHTFPQQGSYTVTLTVTDICGQTASATQVVNVTGVSVEEASSATFSLRPNPTDGPLLLQFGTDAPRTATLMDATGREVLTATLTGTFATLDLSRLSSGIYVLRVAEGISTQHLRVVRQ
jgi:PKD repeat protein